MLASKAPQPIARKVAAIPASKYVPGAILFWPRLIGTRSNIDCDVAMRAQGRLVLPDQLW